MQPTARIALPVSSNLEQVKLAAWSVAWEAHPRKAREDALPVEAVRTQAEGVSLYALIVSLVGMVLALPLLRVNSVNRVSSRMRRDILSVPHVQLVVTVKSWVYLLVVLATTVSYQLLRRPNVLPVVLNLSHLRWECTPACCVLVTLSQTASALPASVQSAASCPTLMELSTERVQT